MWPFGPYKAAPDDRKRLDALEEKVESLTRRIGSLIEDVEEFYAKVNKARQRVVKEDRDAGRAGHPVGVAELPPVVTSKESLRAQMRARIRGV